MLAKNSMPYTLSSLLADIQPSNIFLKFSGSENSNSVRLAPLKPDCLGEEAPDYSAYNRGMKNKKMKNTKRLIKGQFLVGFDMNEEKLKKAKELAYKIVKKHKHLGDLLGQ